MDDTKADILMMFVTEDGQPVLGESTLSGVPGDKFMDGFRPVSSYDDYSNFFEIKNFSFNVKVEPQEQNVGAMPKAPTRALPHMAARPPSAAAGAPGGVPASNDEYDRWRSAKQSDLDTMKYPVKFETFSFDRIIDAASPVFFAYCANQKRFRSATLVKRQLSRSAAISTGASGSGFQSLGFLRMEFLDVLLTSLSWDDGDMVTEKCVMTCADMQVKYKQQAMDGTLSSTASTASWNRQRNSVAKSS